LALKLKKPHLKVKIVCAGLQYGEGEELLHFLFKRAWYGESLPLIGSQIIPPSEENDSSDSELSGANNIVPMIHVKDLCLIVSAIISNKNLEDNYILAVDNSNTTLSEIVKVSREIVLQILCRLYCRFYLNTGIPKTKYSTIDSERQTWKQSSLSSVKRRISVIEGHVTVCFRLLDSEYTH
jgi:hypothetical protein